MADTSSAPATATAPPGVAAKIRIGSAGRVLWNVALEAGGALVGDEVKISISISAVKAQE